MLTPLFFFLLSPWFGADTVHAPDTLEHAKTVANAFFASSDKNNDSQNSVYFIQQASVSPQGFHFTYGRSWRGQPVWESRPRLLHLDPHFTVKRVRQAVVLTTAHGNFVLSEPDLRRLAHERLTERQIPGMTHDSTIWGVTPIGTEARRICRQTFRSGDNAGLYGLWEVDLEGRSGRILRVFNRMLSSSEGEEGRGTVFRYNPVAAGLTNGAIDTSSALINVPLLGLDGSGYLRGQYVDTTKRFSDIPFTGSISHPGYQPGLGYSADLTFDYGPEHPAFEEVMAYYWIDTAQRHLQALGFRINDRPIAVNCHAFTGHNAGYATKRKAIFFGDGRIDTAEDGSVVMHEYGHAVLDAIVGEAFYNDFGFMFHEGFADFFAYAMTELSAAETGPDHYPAHLGEWFFSQQQTQPPYLRDLLPPPFRYPDLSYDGHNNGRLWSSAFYELAAEAGVETGLTLVLQALLETSSADPGAIAKALLNAGSHYAAGSLNESLTRILTDRGLLHREQGEDILKAGNEPIAIPGDNSIHLIEIRPHEMTASLQISFSSEAVGPREFLLARGRIPSRFDFDLRYSGIKLPNWQLTTQASFPLLVADESYYLVIRSSQALDLAVTEKNEADVIASLPAGARIQLPFLEGKPQVWRLENLQEALSLSVFTQVGGDEFAFGWLHLSDAFAYTSEHNWRPDMGELVSIPIFEEAISPYHLDLLETFVGKSTIYLTAEAIDVPPEGSLLLEWRKSQEVASQPLTLGNTVESIIRDGANFWTVVVETPPKNLRFRTDEDHPFTLITPKGDALGSTLQQGVHSIFLQEGGGKLIGVEKTVLGFPPIKGTYQLTVTGEGQYHVNAEIGHEPELQLLSAGEEQTFIMESDELKGFTFTPANDAQSFSLQFGGVPEGTNLLYAFLEANGASTTFRNDFGFVARPKKMRFRQTTEHQQPFYVSGWLEPGHTYQLWVYNPKFPTMEVSLTFLQGEDVLPQPLVLENELSINLDWELDYLHDNDTYVVPIRVVPPADTKRVHFQFDHQAGNREIVMMTQVLDGNWIGYRPYEARLGRNELGFEPNHPFLVYLLAIRNLNFVPGPVSIEVQVTYDRETAYDREMVAGEVQGDILQTHIPHRTLIDLSEPIREIEFSWVFDNPLSKDFILVQADRNPLLAFDGPGMFEQIMRTTTPSPMRIAAPGPLRPLAGDQWIIKQNLDTPARYLVFDPAAVPLNYDLFVQTYPFITETSMPPMPAGHEVQRHSLRVINPTPDPILLQLEEGNLTIPGHGFTLLEGEQHELSASVPVLLYQSASGPSWETGSYLSPVRHAQLFATHVPPLTSAWQSQLTFDLNGNSEATLRLPDETTTHLEAGSHVISLDSTRAGWASLETAIPAQQVFAERSLSALQYWFVEDKVVSETLVSKPTSSCIIAHLAEPNAWWTGLNLANLDNQELVLQVTAFLKSGQPARVGYCTIQPDSSRIDLVGAFLPAGTLTEDVAWLRISANRPKFTAILFTGRLQSGDTAGYTPSSEATDTLLLPGPHTDSWLGVAIVNTVNAAGSLTIKVVDEAGIILETDTSPIDAFGKKLFTGSANLTGRTYYLRVSAPGLKICGFQLVGKAEGGLAAAAAINL